MENKAALRAKGENRMLQKSQEEPKKKEQRISDIHTHVLPGLDDGSKSISASVRMLRKSYRQGVRNVIATPHYTVYHWRTKPEQIQRLMEQMAKAVQKEMPELRLYSGQEIQYFEGMEARGQQENKDAEDQKKGILTWNGKKYRRNTAMRAILCMGIDTKGEMASQVVSGKGGDADAIFLIAEDASRDQAQIVLIPRNTMTEIEVFDYFGEPLGTETQQLTLAYAFGDGREESCELTAEALSKLLFGLKIDGYFAVNMDSIPYFNDAVGGVPVTVDDEMVANQYPEDFKMGETVNLTGDLTEKYVRFRDVDEEGSASIRLHRQKGYLKAFIQKAKESQAADKTTITRLVDGIQKLAITNMAKDQYMDMGLALLNSPDAMEDGDFIELSGKIYQGKFEEFYPDMDELKEIVINLFYKEKA